ncbi:MAG TPA: hypothetical protein VFW63_00500 [Acidimicrobiales bacterium]|nr:hypothetical protein [Acidimicrobiales bacterium]
MSGTQVAASVLASVSAAVVASFFGVAGTVVGAAVVSVVATVGSAAYGVGIRRTRARLRNVQVRQAASLRHSRPSPAVPVAGHGHDRPEGDGDVPSAAGGQAGGRAPRWWPGALARRRWSLAGGLAVVLAGSLGIVTVAEVVNDGPLAGGSHGGRTSIGSLISDDGGDPAPTSTTVDRSPTTTAPTAEPDRQDAPDGGDEPDGSSPTTSEPTSTTEPSGTTTGPDATTTTTPAPTTSLPAGDGTAPTVRSGSATP